VSDPDGDPETDGDVDDDETAPSADRETESAAGSTGDSLPAAVAGSRGVSLPVVGHVPLGVAAVAVAFLGAAILPVVMGSYGVFLGTSILVLAIYGVAYDVAYGYAGLLSFGHAVFFGVGAYAAAFAVADAGLGGAPALVAAVVAGLVAVRVPENGFVILTIIAVLVFNLVAVSWSGLTGGTDGFTVFAPSLGPLALSDPTTNFYVTLGLLGLVLAGLSVLVRSEVGLVFRLVRENERRAELLGYDVRRYKLAALVVSGALTGLAGGLEAFVFGYVNASNFALTVSADPLVYTLIGGRGTLVGPIVGAVALGVAEELLRDATDAYPLFVGAVLIAVVVVEREGVLGAYRRLRDRSGADPAAESDDPDPEPDPDPDRESGSLRADGGASGGGATAGAGVGEDTEVTRDRE
jgi:branched-chain amino acid transport system permease protein